MRNDDTRIKNVDYSNPSMQVMMADFSKVLHDDLKMIDLYKKQNQCLLELVKQYEKTLKKKQV